MKMCNSGVTDIVISRPTSRKCPTVANSLFVCTPKKSEPALESGAGQTAQAPIKKVDFLVVNIGIFNRYLRWLLIKVCSLYRVPVQRNGRRYFY